LSSEKKSVFEGASVKRAVYHAAEEGRH